MLRTVDPRIGSYLAEVGPLSVPRGYQAAPSPDLVLAGMALLQLGQAGELVAVVQRLLNLTGVAPFLALSGLFDLLTRQAVQRYQASLGEGETGAVDADLLIALLTHGALANPRGADQAPRCAPQFGSAAPRGSVPMSSLLRADEARRRGAPASPQARPTARGVPNEAPGGVGPTEGTRIPPSGPADAQLAQLQRASIESARRELAAGVRDDGRNRSPRVDQYARDGGMNVGQAWCGFFTGFNYNEAAREAGGRFTENVRFHSMQKARSYFEYRNYTNNSRTENARLDALQERQTAEGSPRRWMVLSGSGGERHAAANGRPHEVYEPNNLPIREGDTALFSHGHVGMVESYDQRTGRLVTIEGNSTGGRVCRNEYDLNNPAHRARFEGFGRPARSDFAVEGQPAPEAQGPAAPAPNAPAPNAPAPNRAEAPPTGAPGIEERRAAPNNGVSLGLPPRPEGAPTGSEFLASTKGLSREQREEAILQQIQSGNIPDHLRQFQEIEVRSTGRDGQAHVGKLRVLPDYLAVGSNEDFVQVPMTPRVAQAIADRTGTSLPTRKMVDDIYRSADVRLSPQPLPPGAQMMSSEYYARHNGMVESQRAQRGASPGQLTAGHQKDLVISNQLTAHPDRVAIYGWHQPNGRPIQPLSTVHEASYADYSHGVRLVGGTMNVDGVERPIVEVLADPNLAGLISDEGVIRSPRVP
jgi:hypothetical protein